MLTECIATGIENLQIEYGIDTSGNGNPNTYMSAPTLADLQNVVSAAHDRYRCEAYQPEDLLDRQRARLYAERLVPPPRVLNDGGDSEHPQHEHDGILI
jgi:hypothetical protein